MSQVEYKSLKTPKTAGKPSVTSKQFKTSSGEAVTVRTINAESKTFGEDLLYVFERNVEKARRENREIAASENRARSKS
jgi:hypothetical protein